MLTISKEVLHDIRVRKKQEKQIKIYRRLLFLEMKYNGKLNKEIALLLDVSIETLSHWTAIFKKGGINLLCQLHYEGRRTSIMTPYIEEIEKHVKEENVTTIKSLQNWLEKSLNITVGVSRIHEFCKKNSIFLTKKQDGSQGNTSQKKFKKNL